MKQILLNPGPANTSESVKQAQIVDDICPREREFGGIMNAIMVHLPTFVATDHLRYESILFGSSGTGAIEAMISSLPKDSFLLVITNGAYGRRAAEIAKRYAIRLFEIDCGDKVLNYEMISKLIETNPDITHVYTVHCETTTGILNDIDFIGNLCKENNKTFIIDAMSTVGAYEIEMTKSNVDFLIGSSNKCIQGFAGIGFIIARREKLMELKGQARTCYFDVYDQWDYMQKNLQLRFTPPVQTIYAFYQAIKELTSETVGGRHNRYKNNRTLLINGMKVAGVKQYTPEEHSSVIITSFFDLEHPKYSFDDMHDFLKERGITIYPGKVSNTNTFRISNIGTLTIEDIAKFLYEFNNYILYLETK
ncbi:MAG: 2-aminoethylphosphonate--pyruvate transaminase [Candidatus Pacearchaeota archaeon]|jgi:2-aminoethylphosphonate-pyruvate transaminase|nr:2-aminoethylphosphonate--pyruvate transaminase [Clostridia bacterium]